MDALDLASDEGIVLQHEGVLFGRKRVDLYLTNKAIVTLEQTFGLLGGKRVARRRSLDEVKIVEGEVQAAVVKTSQGWVLQVLFADGAERYSPNGGKTLGGFGGKAEAEKWARRIRELLLCEVAAQEASGELDGGFDIKAVVEAPKAAVDAIGGFGSRLAKFASDGANVVAEKIRQELQEKDLLKFDPVSLDRFTAEGFVCPSVIVVEDESVLLQQDYIKENPAIGNLIGWISVENGVSVFHLRHACVLPSGLSFSPIAVCDSVYCFDSVGDRFIDVGQFHELIQQDKMTELRDVAYCLGAKECRVESYEGKDSQSSDSKKADVKAKMKGLPLSSAGVAGEHASTETSSQSRSMVFFQKFEGNDEPVRPNLLWYRESKELNSLIEMRCSKSNPIREYSINFDSSSTSALSEKGAAKVDAAMKGLGVKAGFSFEKKTRLELRKKLVFHVRF